MTDHIEGVFNASSPTGPSKDAQALLAQFGAQSTMPVGDFMFFIADIFTESVQYGGRSVMCANITSQMSQPMSTQMDNLVKIAKDKGVAPKDYDTVNFLNNP